MGIDMLLDEQQKAAQAVRDAIAAFDAAVQCAADLGITCVVRITDDQGMGYIANHNVKAPRLIAEMRVVTIL